MRGHGAGVITLRSVESRPVLARVSDFRCGAPDGEAYWLFRENLCFSSGSRVLYDAITELGPLIGNGGFAYTPAMIQAIRNVGVGEPMPDEDMTDSSQSVTRDWLRAVLWVTYHRDQSGDYRDVVLPRTVSLPAWRVACIDDSAGPPTRVIHWRPDANARNPFDGVIHGEDFDLTGGGSGGGSGGGGSGGGSGGGGSGGGAALALLLGIALLGGEK